ncbi:MAG: 3-oxoadipate enol-lactonase [Candidatus Dormiibacterota bacterium]
MSRFEIAGRAVNYQIQGPSAGPALVLLNSLGTTLELWDPQLPALCRYFRVLRYDYPGHGGSEPRSNPTSVEKLGDELCALLDELQIESASLCGLSLGGMVALSIAARYPARVQGLVAASTSKQMSPSQYWLDRAAQVRAQGLGPIRDQLLSRWFSPSFISAEPQDVARFGAQLTAVDPDSYAAGCEALAAADLTAQLASITSTTLILAGALDQATPLGRGLELQAVIPGAALRVLADAAHLANVEQPEPFVRAVIGHLTGGQLARGTAARRRVLGDEHVDHALASANSFTTDFQELISRYAWGEVWARPGLDRITRRCITIALLVSLGRWEELEMHVRAAAVEDLTADQIAEILLHTAVYCGVPAANAAFDHAQRALSPEDPPS